ncbi:MAG TPA: helix-turn-helix domain-containing protein [Conexibacter sp.]|nr:helix-turn-helix domain-containing protein [Conexibacter sp.]
MSGAATSPRPARKRDAEATRRALLDAGGALFDERGYERATIREIGERAGVDPALIARYFGSKEALYLAVLADEERAARRGPFVADLHAITERVLTRWDRSDGSPVRRVLADPTPAGAEWREIVRRVMEPGVLGPAREAVGDGADAELRAELLLALLVGLSVTRANGTMPALYEAPREELLRQLAPLLDALRAGPGAA